MDLSTEYLGFKLPHPLVPGSSPMGDDLDTVKRLEDAGAPAIVLRSLFEEQIDAGADGRPRLPGRPGGVVRGGDDLLPEPGALRPQHRLVPRAPAQGEGGGEDSGHRLAERGDARRLGQLRPPDAAGGGRRARVERLPPGHRPGDQRCGDRAADGRDRPPGEAGDLDPARREDFAVPLGARARRAAARRGRRQRAGPVQPVLPAGHRRRRAGPRAHARPLGLLRAARCARPGSPSCRGA